MFCDACGTSNRDGARFCRSCGGALPAIENLDTEAAPAREAHPDVPAAVRLALQDGFDVLRPLGQGGMGAVYLARERALDRLVAVKVLRGDPAADPRGVERFLQEARVAARLRHPGIISIHAVGSRNGLHYFTMDYLDGRTLDAVVKGESPSGLDPARARAIVADVARAVGHAHRHDIVHRDLKPSNVMIDSSGRVLVLDFGLAKPRSSGELTTAGAVVGTPQYMSPEQIEGRAATRQTDVYALGLVYYFLLVGEHLVQGDSLSQMMVSHLSGACRARIRSDPRVSEADRAVLLALVEREDERRAGSMDEVLRLLEAAGPPTSAAPPPGAPGLQAAPTDRGPDEPRPVSSPPLSTSRRKARRKIEGLLDRISSAKKRQV
jgi:serine/threonine protein kinase